MNEKVAIYTRVSTAMQIDRDSLQVQKKELITYADLILGIKDYEIFEDPGYSGKNTDRPAYQKMMSRIRRGEFTHLLVWKIDRISRNVLDFAALYQELKKLGVVFVSKNEQFDTGTAIGEAMLKIILVFAELERNMTAERVSAVMLSRANSGQWNGGRVPYGYNYDATTKEFSINPSEEKVILLMYGLYERKKSLLKVSNELNQKGFRTRANNTWNAVSVRKILVSPFYIGHYQYNVHDEKDWSKKPEDEWITIPDHHPAIIEPSRYYAVVETLKQNRRGLFKHNDTYNRTHIHLFAGLIICGNCGGNFISMKARILKNGLRPSRYTCSTRRKNTSICTNQSIDDTALAPFVFQYMSNILNAQKKVTKTTPIKTIKDWLLKGLNCNIPDDNVKELADEMKAEREKITYAPENILNPAKDDKESEEITLNELYNRNNNAIARLTNLYLHGNVMTEPEYITERKKLEDEQKRIEQRLSEIIKEEGARHDSIIASKLSWLVMEKVLEDPSVVDYQKFALAVDMTMPKAFLNATLKHIKTLNGKVSEIVFKNGIKTTFLYD